MTVADKDYEIERRIVIGFIVSTEYVRQVRDLYEPRLIESKLANRLINWCIEYFDKYEQAPFRDIEAIYIQKLHNGDLPNDIAEEIEEDILPELNEKYEQEKFNYQYLLDQTKQLFHERQLLEFSEQIKNLVESGEVIEAEKIASSYYPATEQTDGITLNNQDQLNNSLERAFEEGQKPLIYYPGALGQFWNDQLVRGGFIGLLAPEKRGKSFIMIDMAIRANRQGCNVAFFEAGDMTETQTLRRMATYLTKTPIKEKHCTETYFAIPDCYYNQVDECGRDDRESDSLLFDSEDFDPNQVTRQTLIQKYEENPDHVVCRSRACPYYEGAIWLEKRQVKGPLDLQKAKKKMESFFTKRKAKFKLSTHPNGTLTVNTIRSLLSSWEKGEGFSPDVVIIDYADLLEPDKNVREYRHQLNDIWKALRRITEERHCLLITATQADIKGQETDTLKLKNFSENKRWYGHVTAGYGLNRDAAGREKKLGILRINELVIREDDSDVERQVKVTQALRIGRPVQSSFF